MHSPSSVLQREEHDPKVHQIDAPVIDNTVVNGEYRCLVLSAPVESMRCKPGQFFHLLCPAAGSDQPYLRRPMSIYDFDEQNGRLRFLYKVTGAGTRGLATLRKGDTLDIVGPLGNGYSIADTWQNLLLVARGVGLATLAPLAREAQKRGHNLTAICSARTPDVLMSTDLFESMGAKVITVTDSEGTSDVENLSSLISNEIETYGVDALYTCGSNRLLTLLQKIGTEYNIPGEIALEQQMACGLGMCHCCVRPFLRDGEIIQERVCREGPVFSIQEAMAW
ncbi:dihydroorotate dehydrogenase electron transfer subunit [Qingshengfaniella alkalisoli]|uniref:Dihydroorotate dehydrogenase electron transfer subunit n=1 Tax=Qingshengfaniella alkalisoli TaxID=2599296 RepID=A0A5B8IXN3_9RHOB|nr:dihydroorotate dehydrogenase electron transfer subunit [Qingshengfaniella alkalisoli]QDY69378.1 dihydroorotate dehydrogenase electron transfer subunit [Qingshengfaniella alkalisoli]